MKEIFVVLKVFHWELSHFFVRKIGKWIFFCFVRASYLHGSILTRSVTLYGSMHIAQQSFSISLSSDFMLFVGIFEIIRLATVHN